MFDISTGLVSEQDEISGVKTIDWENHSWKYLSLIGEERIINLQRTKVYVFSDSVLCLGKIHQNPNTIEIWRPVVHAQSSSYSEWNDDKTWISQEWKSDELMDARTERTVVCSQQADQFVIENDETNSYTEAESEMSLKSRSFLHRVNDQVRKRQKQSSKDATKDSDKHSVIWECLCLQHWEHLYSW